MGQTSSAEIKRTMHGSNQQTDNDVRAYSGELEARLVRPPAPTRASASGIEAAGRTRLCSEHYRYHSRAYACAGRFARVKTASRSFYQTFNVSPAETEGAFIYDLGNGQWNIPRLRALLEEVLPKALSFRDLEIVQDIPSLGKRVMLLNAQKLWREGNHTELTLLAIEDVTERRRAEEEIENALAELKKHAEELHRSNEELEQFAQVPHMT